MTAVSRSAGPVVVDIQSLQSPSTRGRGIARYTLDWAIALEAERPDLVSHYILNPRLAPPGTIDELVATGKVTYGQEHLGDEARIWHVMSPFDGELSINELWPDGAFRQNCLLSATVYDLIPAANLERELIDPMDRRRYRTRLEFVRTADQLQVLSTHVANELQQLLQVHRDALAIIGAAPSPLFRPLAPSSAHSSPQASSAIAALGVIGPFVLYPSGNHPRKNNEALVRAFATTPPSVRNEFQLVITGAMPMSTRHHLEHLANEAGAPGRVVVTGEVDDEALRLLYQHAALVCIPSLDEGYGLPIAEALASDTPVIASDRPPFDELIDTFARFDPTSDEAIGQALTSALTDPAQKIRLSEQRGTGASWNDVASRAGAAFDKLLSRPRATTRHRDSTALRLAFVTPLPPAASGVANYSFRLIEELLRLGSTVDVFVEGLTEGSLAPGGATTYGVDALCAVEQLTGPYDQVVYTLGNSHHHLGALALLRQRPGVVLSHDVRLTNLYRHEHGDPGLLRGGFKRALQAMYGDVAKEIDIDGDLTERDLASHGLFMAREAIQCSEAFLVTSHAAAALARIDAGDKFKERIDVLPFAIEATVKERGFVEGAGVVTDGASPLRSSSPNELGPGQLIAHFGIADPSKLPFLLVNAVAQVRSTVSDLRVAFVGPISERLAEALTTHAAAMGLSDALILTGAISGHEYQAWLQRASVAVQLRRAFNGEASAAVGECLASGVPTIVSALGWFGELPNDSVIKVRRDVDDRELAQTITELLKRSDQRQALRVAAREYAETHSFEHSAAELLRRLRVAPRNVVPENGTTLLQG